MAFSLVQQHATTHGTGTYLSDTCAFTSNVSAGNLIVVSVTGNSNTDIASVTDNLGNTYAVASALAYNAAGRVWNKVYYAAVTTGGACTVTVTYSATTASDDIRIYEFTGFAGTPMLDQSNTDTGSGGSYYTGAITTTHATELLFAAAGTTGGVASYGTGWTGLQITANGDADEWQAVASTGTYGGTSGAAQFVGGTDDWGCNICSFYAGAAAFVAPPAPIIARQAARRAATW